ncbi:MAG: DNA internalization-related competence protein ComEC/Rec2 [Pseudomonadaceae bacterium]|nr:DNA internalization-related competence protein ComEC/Rec2 [Pseudomonadaceae bacterium]
MRTALLALVAGMLLLRFLPSLPSPWALLLMLVGGILLLPWRSYPIALFLFGFTWACFSAQTALDDRLAPELNGRTLWLQGRVVGLPQVSQGVVRFELEQAISRRAELPQRPRLAWYGGPAIHAGEHWRLAVKLKRAHGLVNPQAFDYEAWLLAQRIGATGSVKSGELLSPASGMGAWRDRLRQQLLATPAHGREGGLTALVLGDESGLSSADWQVLQNTGTVHLMVISGQHIGLLATLLYGLIAGLARLGWWPRALPWLPCACLLAFSGALAYGGLAGMDVPVQRACVMVGLVLLWRWRFRQLGLWLPVLVALVVVLLAEPLASLQPGFWLSFAAVMLLILIFSGRLGAWSWWRSLLRAQWAMAVGLLPLLLALGLPVSSSGPLANLVAVPVVGLVVVPLALLGTLLLPVPWLGAFLWGIAGWVLDLLFLLLVRVAQWLPAWLPSDLSVGVWLLIALGALLLLLPAALPMRSLGVLMLLPLVFSPQQRPAPGQAEVWMLDVGQGLSVLVRTHQHNLLYDAGPRFGEFDTGERVVLPSLRALDVRGLDLLLLSHADNDHAGGAEAIVRGLPVSHVRSGEPGQLATSLRAEACVSGQHWQWDGVSFQTWHWAQARDGNQASCVLLIETNGERLWLTGDIDNHAERALLGSGLPVPAQWLFAPHHGSRSSSSADLLAQVRPRAVLVSRGAHNAFGHPHPEVLTRYQALDAQVLDTAQHGAVRIHLGAFEPAQRLRDQARFWREK